MKTFNISGRDLHNYLVIDQEEERAWIPFDLSKIIYQKKEEGIIAEGGVEIGGEYKTVKVIPIEKAKVFLEERRIEVYGLK